MAYLNDETKERLSKLVASLKWHEHEVKTVVRENKDTDTDTLMTSEKRTLIRWAECPHPKDCVGLIEFLASKDCLPLLQLSGKTLEEGEWRPTIAWFEQDEPSRASTNSSPRTFKIYHALRNKTDESGIDGPYVLNDGCRSKTTATFYWEVDEVPECPPSTSGKNYNLSIRSRDTTDGTYDCVISCTENIAYDVDPHLTHQDLHSDVTRAEYLGVRGDTTDEVVNKTIAKAVADGLEVSDREGVTIDMSIRKQDDCTSDVVLVNTEHMPNEDYSKRTREGAVNSVTELTGKNLPASIANAVAWTPEASTNDSHNITAAREGVGTLVEVVKQYTDGGVRDVTVREHKAYKWYKEVPLAPDRNGGLRNKVIFQNISDAELVALAKTLHEISYQINDFGLWDGAGTKVIRWSDDNGGASGEVWDQHEQYSYEYKIRSEVVDRQGEGATRFYSIVTYRQILRGIVRDHNLTTGTSNNPNTILNGLSDTGYEHIGRAGDGFFKFSAVQWQVEGWYDSDPSTSTEGLRFTSVQSGTRKVYDSQGNVIPLPTSQIWADLWEHLGIDYSAFTNEEG